MIKLLLLFTVLILLITACFLPMACVKISSAFFPSVQGSGKIVTETRTLKPYKTLEIQTVADVEVTQGDLPSFRIEGDDNILAVIHAEVKDNKLIISSDHSYSSPKGVKVRITVPTLEGVDIEGAGSLKTMNSLTASKFNASIEGSGDIDADITAAHIKSEISGAGDVTLRGTADFYEAEVAGSGSIHAFDLKAKKGSISISGSGDGEVNCSEALDAEVSGSGEIFYKGEPPVFKTSISGSGSVERK